MEAEVLVRDIVDKTRSVRHTVSQSIIRHSKMAHTPSEIATPWNSLVKRAG